MTTTTADEQLVLSARLGDRSAFAELVQRYQNLVFGVAYNHLGDLDRSEDIAQQTFVVAWEKRLNVREPSKIRSWLCGIARNLARNDARKKAAAPKSIDVAQFDPADVESSPEDSSVAKEESEMLWAILDAIPEKYREPMILHYREEVSTSDIADALDVSTDVVRQRLSRGRQMLEARVAEFVAEGLSKQRLSNGFVAGVLTAIPVATPKAITLSVLSTLSLQKLVAIFAIMLGPILGIAGGIYGAKRSYDQASSNVERRFIWQFTIIVSMLVVLLLAIQFGAIVFMPEVHRSVGFQITVWGSYLILLVSFITYGNRRLRVIKLNHGTIEEQKQLTEFPRALPTQQARFHLCAMIVGSTLWMPILSVVTSDWLGLAVSCAMIATIAFMADIQMKHADSPGHQRKVMLFSAAIVVIVTLIVLVVRWNTMMDWMSSLN